MYAPEELISTIESLKKSRIESAKAFADLDPGLAKTKQELLKMEEELTIDEIADGIHEAVHFINRQLKSCGNEGYPYIFNGKIFNTELRPQETENYSIIDEEISSLWKSKTHQLRYLNYILKSKNYSGNDFHVLIDELDAYITAAHVEYVFLAEPNYGIQLPQEMTTLDGNAGGMLEFMGYLLYYLKAARLHHQDSYRAIASKSTLIKLLDSMWSNGEQQLIHLAPYSTEYGGKILISKEILDDIFSENIITELDYLKIKHIDINLIKNMYTNLN